MNPPHKRWPDPSASPRWKDYSICRDGIPLNSEERKKFFQLIRQLRPQQVHKIYRGNDRTLLLPRYGVGPDSLPKPFNELFFLYGDKGRNFLQDLTSQASTATKKFSIEEVSDAFFDALFDMLKNALEGTHERLVRRDIDTFMREQPAVPAFFSDPTNKTFLKKAVATLSDLQKARVRDYYLTLLHHLQDDEYHPRSFLLSTTTSFQVACRFCESARRVGNDLIVFGWVPRRSARIFAAPRFAPGKGNLLPQLGLPTYDRSIFPKEQEITLKGALFPDYIYGYLYSDKGQRIFEVNPYLFATLPSNWIQTGLPVDQAELWSKLNETRIANVVILDLESGRYSSI